MAVLAATEEDLDELTGSVAAEGNHEPNRRRQRRLDAVYARSPTQCMPARTGELRQQTGSGLAHTRGYDALVRAQPTGTGWPVGKGWAHILAALTDDFRSEAKGSRDWLGSACRPPHSAAGPLGHPWTR